mmetsp:Transcript_7675/g.26012  ORF Transcript_7675/g.26012 Transcript_7675/m.26012 type:complete len:390 (+) Transcript_7675:270-1439(+)
MGGKERRGTAAAALLLPHAAGEARRGGLHGIAGPTACAWRGPSAHAGELGGLAALAEDVQEANVRAPRLPEAREHLVLHPVVPAHVNDDGRNGGVVVLGAAGEQVVHDLVVERAALEGHEPAVVRKVDARPHLRHGPLVLGGCLAPPPGLERRPGGRLAQELAVLAAELALGRHVGDLEVEGEVEARHVLREAEEGPEVGRVPHGQRQVQPEGGPDHLGEEHLRPSRRGDGVHTLRSVDARAERLREVLHAHHHPEETVQHGEVEPLVAVHPRPPLARHEAPDIAGLCLGQVRVDAVHVGVHVVAHNVLVVPGRHVAPRVDVHEEAPHGPPPLRVPKGHVRRVVHHVHKRQRLQAAERHGQARAKQHGLGPPRGVQRGEDHHGRHHHAH